MIGPAARAHAIKALELANRAELACRPGRRVEEIYQSLARAQIEMIRAQAFALLQHDIPTPEGL